MQVRILLLLLLGCCIGNINTNAAGDSYKIYLVRHAEKQTDAGKDPGLTDAGVFRAEQLTTWFQDKDIREIWSSDYRRSRDTVEPLLLSLGLELTLYDPRDLQALAKDLLDRRNNALVVGHSNTTPELARLLCGCVVSDMDDSEYDRLIVVVVTDGEKRIETLIQNTLFQP
ncbi:MAG: phosphoglycerate mutase family protein [Xanthomonadales bacterium]|nr:phosphoglycerate mutase family protein [Xanthomonadales bacterium]